LVGGILGFVAINATGVATSTMPALATGMPQGTYCNVIADDFDPANPTSCLNRVTVLPGGLAQIAVQAYSAIAIHIGAKIN
jgi:alpha-amylase